MAMTVEEVAPWVVGFSGRAVKGAGAMRSPVFEQPEGQFFLPSQPQKTYTRPELEEYVQSGYATLLTRPREYRRIPGGVVVYAERTYVLPREGMFDLSHLFKATDETFEYQDDVGIYTGYFSRDMALAILRTWGEALVADAETSLRPTAPKWERAFDSACRAQIAAPPPEHKDIRQRAFVAMAVARAMMGKDVEDVFHIVRQDRNVDLLHAVENAAKRWIEDIRRATARGLHIGPTVRRAVQGKMPLAPVGRVVTRGEARAA